MSDMTKDVKSLEQENKKLHEQLNDAVDRLISAQKDIQKEVDKVREEVSLEYEQRLKEYKFKADKAETDKENALSEVRKCKKQIKDIKDKMEEKIQMAVLEKTAAFYDYTPRIFELCDKMDEISGAGIAELQSMYEASGHKFDDVSKQRLRGVYNNLQHCIEVMEEMLGIKDIQDQIRREMNYSNDRVFDSNVTSLKLE